MSPTSFIHFHPISDTPFYSIDMVISFLAPFVISDILHECDVLTGIVQCGLFALADLPSDSEQSGP